MSNLNPFNIVDSILADWASPRVRRTIHALLTMAAAVVSIYLAADGDWRQAAVAFAALLYAGANHANTHDLPEGNDV